MKRAKLCRAVSGILALARGISLASCGAGGGQTAKEHSGDGKVFEKPTTIKIAMSSDPTWPNNENWKLWQYMKEETGANFEVQAIPVDEFGTKVSLMMAAKDTLPDLLHVTMKKMLDQFAGQGAFAAFDDNMDKLPNYQKFMSTLPEKEATDLLNTRKCADGKIYNAPAYGTQTVNNARAWMYRKDVFDKHNLKVPKTYDELYTVCKELKKLYPDSYPLCFRDAFTRIRMMGPQWKPYLSFDVYYDFNTEKWCFGAAEPETKKLVEWLSKMRAEGLAPPDLVDIKSKTWEELMSTDRGFITLDYIVRIDFFNNLIRPQKPEYDLAIMEPPRKSATEGQNKMCKISLDMSGYAIPNTGKKDRMDSAFKLVDWMYTDKAAELLGWGKKDETYTEKDGKREFILPKKEDSPRALYGIGSLGLYQRIPTDAYEATYSKQQIEACHTAMGYLEDYMNPMWWLSFTDEENKEYTDLDAQLSSYTQQKLGGFISGQLPMSEWDAYVKELNTLGVDRLLELYTTAYNRAIGK
ncbi:MAG: extracellular solute-binding protein [Clostridia bacterium]